MQPQVRYDHHHSIDARPDHLATFLTKSSLGHCQTRRQLASMRISSADKIQLQFHFANAVFTRYGATIPRQPASPCGGHRFQTTAALGVDLHGPRRSADTSLDDRRPGVLCRRTPRLQRPCPSLSFRASRMRHHRHCGVIVIRLQIYEVSTKHTAYARRTDPHARHSTKILHCLSQEISISKGRQSEQSDVIFKLILYGQLRYLYMPLTGCSVTPT